MTFLFRTVTTISLGLQNTPVAMTAKKLFLFSLLSISSFIVRSQTADDVINRYVSFIGGEQNWKTVKTITSSGIYNYGGMEFPFISYAKAPQSYKYIVTANGKSFIQSYDGNQGWRIDGFNKEKQKTILKGKNAIAMANEADVEQESPFINYRKKGHTVLLEGIDTTKNQSLYKIKLTRKNGDTSTCFFDKESFALVREKAVSKNTEMNNALLDIGYSDYKTIGGIKMPHKIAYTAEGQNILTITVKEVKLNVPVADQFFRP